MTKKANVEGLLGKVKRLAKLVMAHHHFYEGTVQAIPKCVIIDRYDLIMYGPVQDHNNS